jgi:hypothetical protein
MERIEQKMIKRVALGTLLVALIGVLVAGAIIRTIDKTENVAEARGEGHGRTSSQTVAGSDERLGQSRGSQVQGGGYGRSATATVGTGSAHAVPSEAWAVYEGTVVQAPGDGVDLVITTDDGEEIAVGTGPSYMEAQGFVLQAGERVQVEGYWEDGAEFKAAQITRLQDGETIALRDQVGRPAWAGNGRGATDRLQAQTTAPLGSTAPGEGTGIGLSEVDEWVTLDGVVASVDSVELVVQTTDGQEILVDGRPWLFTQEQGFSVQVGDHVTLIGFYEDGDPLTSSGHSFEVGQIQNASTGQTVVIREDSGRPLWAGGGRRGG